MSKPGPPLDVDAVAQLYAQGSSLDQVAAALGISTSRVRTVLRQADVQPRRPGRPSPVSDEQILTLRSQGLTWTQVGKEVGITTRGIESRWRRLAAAGHVDPKPSRPIDTDRIVALHRQGLSIPIICVRVGHGRVVVTRALLAAGVDPKRGPRRVVSETQLLELRATGLSWNKIADQLGVNRSTVVSRWRMMRLAGTQDPRAAVDAKAGMDTSGV